jgi:hypothetical protein
VFVAPLMLSFHDLFVLFSSSSEVFLLYIFCLPKFSFHF